MVNRNRSEMERVRRYYDPDDDDGTPALRDRVSWFGLRLKVGVGVGLAFGNSALMVVLVAARWQFGDRISWLPVESIRFDIAFLALIIVMSFFSFTMFRAVANMFRQDIRDIDARMARRDNATEEEVQEFVRKSEREMAGRIFKRWLVVLAVIVPVIPIFGTNLIFPWGGFGSMAIALFVTVILICASIYFSPRLAEMLRRIAGSARN